MGSDELPDRRIPRTVALWWLRARLRGDGTHEQVELPADKCPDIVRDRLYWLEEPWTGKTITSIRPRGIGAKGAGGSRELAKDWCYRARWSEGGASLMSLGEMCTFELFFEGGGSTLWTVFLRPTSMTRIEPSEDNGWIGWDAGIDADWGVVPPP